MDTFTQHMLTLDLSFLDSRELLQPRTVLYVFFITRNKKMYLFSKKKSIVHTKIYFWNNSSQN